MTVLDKNEQFSDSQALTATADSTNYRDNTIDRDMGPGEPLAAIVYVESVLGGTTPTLSVSIETDDNASFTSGTVIATSQVYSAAQVGSGIEIVVAVPQTNERYMQLIYTMTGTSPTATVSAYLQPLSSAESQSYYPNNYTIS